MVFQPFKRVGEPTSFKGIKGPYLFLAMFYTAGLIFILLIVFIVRLSITIQVIAMATTLLVWLFKINEFKKKSKKGDIHRLNKDRCRKNLNITGDVL